MNMRPALTRAALLAVLTLSLLNAAAPASAGPGYALSINGINQYITATIPALASNYTVTAWINLRQGGTETFRVGVLSGSCDATVEFLIHSLNAYYDDTQYFELGRCGAFNGEISFGAMLPNEWTHVAVTVDSNMQVTYYMDGDEAGGYDGSGYNLTLGPNITLADNVVRTFKGTLDEAQIWSVALTQAQIQAGMNEAPSIADPNLVAYWPLNEGTGSSTTADATGHGHMGTLVNSPTWVVSTVPFVPDATTAAATGVSASGATLNGAFNPNGQPTTAWFQWGPTTNYGNTTAAGSYGGANASLAISATLSDLAPDSTLHFQLVASNSVGAATGVDMTFQTPVFAEISAGLPTVSGGSVAWGDFDNDGRLDILITGAAETGDFVAYVYHNNGDGTFTWDANAGLPGVVMGSAAWGDYDNDGRLDILITGLTKTGSFISRIYHNNGNGTFTDINAGLPGVMMSSVAWGDYDNDGRLDFLLLGELPSGLLTRLYHNNGDGTFTDINAGLPPLAAGSAAWGDYDNDGRLDILIAGGSQSGNVSRVYHNNGNGTFTDINAGLPGVESSSVAWGDYDNDGRLDILIIGELAQGSDISRVYHNNGNGTFTDINAGLPGVAWGSAAWGDYDNDGRLDILLIGELPSDDFISGVYHNNGDGTFTDISAGLPGESGSAVWGDYDNDGRLDFLLMGETSMHSILSVYRNFTSVTNAPPSAPTGLTATVSNNLVALNWAAASDAQTPDAGLTYNLRVGSTPGGCDLVSPESDPASGWRRLPQMGGIQASAHATVDMSDWPGGLTCYWSVQAIDVAWAASPFAEGGSFYGPPGDPIAITLPAVNVASNQATLQGSVNPRALPTFAWFEWGTTSNYGNFTGAFTPGEGRQALPISAPVIGLAPRATYHYRIEAYNDLGVVSGVDRCFTTPDARRSITACCLTGAGALQFQFTGAAGSASSYTVLSATNLTLPLSQWAPVGNIIESPAGHYQFTDIAATNQPTRFYIVRWR